MMVCFTILSHLRDFLMICILLFYYFFLIRLRVCMFNTPIVLASSRSIQANGELSMSLCIMYFVVLVQQALSKDVCICFFISFQLVGESMCCALFDCPSFYFAWTTDVYMTCFFSLLLFSSECVRVWARPIFDGSLVFDKSALWKKRCTRECFFSLHFPRT